MCMTRSQLRNAAAVAMKAASTPLPTITLSSSKQVNRSSVEFPCTLADTIVTSTVGAPIRITRTSRKLSSSDSQFFALEDGSNAIANTTMEKSRKKRKLEDQSSVIEIMTAEHARKCLHEFADADRAAGFSRFFKCGEGEYAEGDIFLGLKVPQTREVCAQFRNLPLSEVKSLLQSMVHEERLLALFILVAQFQKADEATQRTLFKFYLEHSKYVNNWDLVDSSAHLIVGAYIFERNRGILYELADSTSLWDRRISIISTLYFIRKGDVKETIKLASVLLNDKEHLIHTAVGWMLREAGKKDKETLTSFLSIHHKTMPRTMLRYSIEKFSATERARYLNKD